MKGNRRLRNERGSVLLFMIGTLLFLLVFGGFAVDLSFFSAVKGELQRSMDAAALAGAGHLGFDDSTFPAVRQEAWRFGDLNPARVGAVNLALNPANDPNGDITLGVWDGASFTPSLDGSQVNAVRAQYATEVPTSFLGILGFNTLPVSAQAIAVANPPLNPPPNACVIPIGVSECAFVGGGSPSSQGCGTLITFMTSSGQQGGPPPGTNNAAWINLDGEAAPNANYLRNLINEMANNNCATSTLSARQPVGTNNGLVQNVVNTLETAFFDNYTATSAVDDWITVSTASGDEVYNGPGWDVSAGVIGVPNIDSPECPPGAISGTHTIRTFTRFVMTQVINKGICAVDNDYNRGTADGNPWDPLCPVEGNGTGTNLPQNPNAFRAIFGYFSCGLSSGLPTTDPAPRAGIATGRRLVQ